MTTAQADKLILRLRKVSRIIQRASFASKRNQEHFVKYINEYDEIAAQLKDSNHWLAYCEKVGADPTHNGFDCGA